MIKIRENEVWTSAQDAKVRVYDRHDETLIRRYRGLNIPVYEFVIRDQVLYAGTWVNTIRAIDLDSDELVTELVGHMGYVKTLALFGNRLISGSNDKSIRLWNLDTGNCEQILLGHEGPLSKLVVDEAAARLFSAADEAGIRVWDLKRGETIRVLKGHTDWVHSLALDAAADLLFSGGGQADPTIRIWDTVSFACLSVLHGHTGSIKALAVCGNLIASASWDLSVKTWSLPLEAQPATGPGAAPAIPTVAVVRAPETSSIASGVMAAVTAIGAAAATAGEPAKPAQAGAELPKRRKSLSPISAADSSEVASLQVKLANQADVISRMSTRLQTVEGELAEQNAIIALMQKRIDALSSLVTGL